MKEGHSEAGKEVQKEGNANVQTERICVRLHVIVNVLLSLH